MRTRGQVRRQSALVRAHAQAWLRLIQPVCLCGSRHLGHPSALQHLCHLYQSGCSHLRAVLLLRPPGLLLQQALQ
jgi:hypothetical protein